MPGDLQHLNTEVLLSSEVLLAYLGLFFVEIVVLIFVVRKLKFDRVYEIIRIYLRRK